MDLLGMLMALGAAVLWGTNGIFVHLLSEYGATGAQITVLRYMTVPVVLFIYLMIADRNQLRINKKDIKWFALNGMIGLFGFAIFYTYSIQKVGMGTAAVLIYLMPTLVSLYGVVVHKEKLTAKKIVVLVMSLAACGLVSGLMSGFAVNAIGVLFGIFAAFCYGFYSIMAAERFDEYTSNTVSLYSFMFAMICAIIYTAIGDGIGQTVVFYISNPGAILISIIYGIVCSLISYLLYTTAVKKVGPGGASIMATSEPVVAVIFGVVLYNEGLDGWAILGIVMEVTALILMVVKKQPGKANG